MEPTVRQTHDGAACYFRTDDPGERLTDLTPRIVACVNGCDAAGIVRPEGLARLVAACDCMVGPCEYVGEHCTMVPRVVPCRPCELRAALAAVRGE